MARKRNPNSHHQRLMAVLFGKKEAAKLPTAWRLWPEPYRSIYSRMFASRQQLVDSERLKRLSAAEASIANLAALYSRKKPGSGQSCLLELLNS